MTAIAGQRLRYCQLMYTYAPAWGFGGPSRVLYDYARWMVQRGAEVSVIAGDIHHDYSALPRGSAMVDGIPVHRVRVFMRSLVRKAINLVSPRMFFLAARLAGAGAGPLVLHIGELRSTVFLYAAVLKRLRPRRVVLVHSAFGMLHAKPSRIRAIFDPVFMGFMIRSVDVGLAQNDHEAGSYRELCRQHRAAGTRVVLLPLHTSGPETPSLSPPDKHVRKGLRRRYGIQEDAFVCIFLGRLHAAKGVLRTIDAFLAAAARLACPSVLLVVGRDDGFQARIAEHIAEHSAGDRIRIVNDVYGERRFEYYALSDLFLGFPDIYEETMLASVEALSCGTPVVVSREADLPFVEASGAGYVIDFTVDAAVQAIHRVAVDSEQFRQRAFDAAMHSFALDPVCARLHDILAGLGRVAGEVR